jgi:glycyl-tRNA synthetase
VDHDTLTDQAVTIRDRDTMAQERIPIADLAARVTKKWALHNCLTATHEPDRSSP